MIVKKYLFYRYISKLEDLQSNASAIMSIRRNVNNFVCYIPKTHTYKGTGMQNTIYK